jgi:hypothetical protein
MLKRYIIIKNNKEIGEADLHKEIYQLLGCSKQHFVLRLKEDLFNDGVNFKGDRYNLIDRVNPKV